MSVCLWYTCASWCLLISTASHTQNKETQNLHVLRLFQEQASLELGRLLILKQTVQHLSKLKILIPGWKLHSSDQMTAKKNFIKSLQSAVSNISIYCNAIYNIAHIIETSFVKWTFNNQLNGFRYPEQKHDKYKQTITHMLHVQMYGSFTYIRWNMATFKGKCR